MDWGGTQRARERERERELLRHWLIQLIVNVVKTYRVGWQGKSWCYRFKGSLLEKFLLTQKIWFFFP